MTSVKRIRVAGFRGILAPLEIDFVEGKTPQSVVLYGGNATGKSSLTDAWEWLMTGKIQHLAREGAEEGAYPHMTANPNATFVEVEFSGEDIGKVGLVFDQERKTMPTASGNLDAARRLITHPCHIRYGDLTRFVFMRKAERYDALASLMGFVPQMEYQKALRRVQTQIQAETSRLQDFHADTETRFTQHFQLSQPTEALALQRIAEVCQAHSFPTDPTIESARVSKEMIAQAVANDPKARRLADLQTVETATKACALPATLGTQIKELRDAVGRLKAEQKEQLKTQLLIPLFQAADELFSKIPPAGQCPLCGLDFNRDLKEHVKGELARMRHVEGLLKGLRSARETLNRALSSQKTLAQTFDAILESAKPEISQNTLSRFRDTLTRMDETLSRLRRWLTFDSTAITDEVVDGLKQEQDAVSTSCEDFDETKSALLREASERKAALDKDATRIKLVADAQFVTSGLQLIWDLRARNEEALRAREVLVQFAALVEDYVSVCLADVENRFVQISEKVKVFFEILERHGEGMSGPKLRLLTDQDRSVVLEVIFHGTPIQPAHKYLSESQLSSFGLAVFVASATHFNKECRFLVLDDVVNSFDAHKRPQLIELIRDHLKDHQVLLLTHDRVWRDLLHRSLPRWKRINFTNYSFGVGPTVSPGLDTIERVSEALGRDEADEAGQIFAKYLEDVLQELCESFEVEVKFNRRNEYTLDTLLDRLRVRVQEKLTKSHPLARAISSVHEGGPYRNWCIHCKNPESPIHSGEVKSLVADWRAVEEIVRCKECFEFVRYDGRNAFQCCRCGKTTLTKLRDQQGASLAPLH